MKQLDCTTLRKKLSMGLVMRCFWFDAREEALAPMQNYLEQHMLYVWKLFLGTVMVPHLL